MSSVRKSVTVYCGSKSGHLDDLKPLAWEMGAGIGRRGWRLVYGGANIGLMGTVADGALSAGGEVLGILPDVLEELEIAHVGLTELRKVPSMHARKKMLIDEADALIAIPGGLGTLDEFIEALTWRVLRLHSKPCALFSPHGFYDPMIQQLRQMEEHGFVKAGLTESILQEPTPEALLDALGERMEAPC